MNTMPWSRDFFAAVLVAALLASIPWLAQAKSNPGIAMPDVQMTFAPPRSAEEDQLLERLRQAKRDGDEAAAATILESLGWEMGHATDSPLGPEGVQVLYHAAREDPSARWAGDIRVTNLGEAVVSPSLGVAGTGEAYLGCAAADNTMIYIYYSDDGGITWAYSWGLWTPGYDVSLPSLAIGEGNVNRLLCAFLVSDTTTQAAVALGVWTIDLDADRVSGTAWLDVSGLTDFTQPTICVDTPEYAFWYPYVIFGAQDDHYYGTDWMIEFCLSTDYGETFTTPDRIAVPEAAYGTPDMDINFGGGRIFVPFTEDSTIYDHPDIHIVSSGNFGASWDYGVLTSTDEARETQPAVAAIHGASTVLVTYVREYEYPDTDVEAMYSTDSGENWNWTYLPYINGQEVAPDLTVSLYQGHFHAAFWREFDVIYTKAPYTDPTTWTGALTVNEGNTALGPTIATNPDVDSDACIAWPDFRNEISYNIYFDAVYWDAASAETWGAEGESRLVLLASPEPSASEVVMRFHLRERGSASLSIVDVQGRTLRTVLDRMLPAGEHCVTWMGTDAYGRPVPAGVYYGRLRFDREVTYRKETVVR